MENSKQNEPPDPDDKKRKLTDNSGGKMDPKGAGKSKPQTGTSETTKEVESSISIATTTPSLLKMSKSSDTPPKPEISNSGVALDTSWMTSELIELSKSRHESPYRRFRQLPGEKPETSKVDGPRRVPPKVRVPGGQLELPPPPTKETVPSAQLERPPPPTRRSEVTFASETSDSSSSGSDESSRIPSSDGTASTIASSHAHAERRRPTMVRLRRLRQARVIELTKKKAADIFGANSALGDTNQLLFFRHTSSEDDTRSVPSGDTSGPDKSWLVDWSGDDDDDDDETMSEIETATAPQKRVWTYHTESMNASFSPIFIVMFLCGRLPFSGGLTTQNEIVYFSTRKSTWKFLLFAGSSAFLASILLLMIVSTYAIYIKDADDSSDPFVRLELLTLQKYWLQVCIFVAMLAFTTFCNVVALCDSDKVTTLLNNVVNEINRHNNLDLTKWIWIYGVGHLFALANYFIYMIIMFATETTPAFYGGTKAIAVVLFHFVKIDPPVRLNFMILPYALASVLVLQMYVMLCSRMCILLPMLSSILIRNMAANRNLRIGLVLGKVKPSGNTALEKLKKSLTYKNVFAFHNSANRLLREFSNHTFPYEICAYYLMKCCILSLCMFKIASSYGITFFKSTQNQPQFKEKAIIEAGVYIEYYEDDSVAEIYDGFVFIGVSLLGFITVTEVFANCSSTFLNGLYYVQAHSLLKCIGSQQRRFILSLNACFTGTNPYVINPASLFEINRRFIIRIIEWSAFVFLIFIQTQSNPIITSPIYGLCNDGNGGQYTCIIGHLTGPQRSVGPLADKTLEKAKEQKNITTPISPNITTPIPIPKPPIPILQSLYQPNDFSKFSEYCPGTDIVRMIGFDSNYTKIPLPLDRLECIIQPYNTKTTIFDAFGNDVSEKDDCGFPKFPIRSSYNDFKPIYPSKMKISTFNCWNFQPGNTIGRLAVRPYTSDYTCGYPTDFAELLCMASMQNWLPEQTKEALIKLDIEIRKKSNIKLVSDACAQNDFDAKSLEDEFKKSTVVTPHFATPYFYIIRVDYSTPIIFVRFIPFTKEGQPWPFRIDNWKYYWAPYTSTSISNNCAPGLYYDCTGKLLTEFDDAGFLPFSYFDKNGNRADPKKVDVDIEVNGNTVNCFSIPFIDKFLVCGVLVSNPAKLTDEEKQLITQHIAEWGLVLSSPPNHLIGYN